MRLKITAATRRLSLVVVVLALGATSGCKGTATPSTDFGVNITVEAKALSATERMKASIGSLQVTGAETEVKQFSIAGAITSGELRFRFIPKDQTGMLKFHFDALDSAGDLFGSGDSPEVTLATTAVSTTITLTASGGTQKGDGTRCTAASECQSGFCTDNVCCSELCNDICVSCAQSGSVGLCVPYPQGMDPEAECSGSSADTDGGAGGPSDGGPSDAGLTINAPEGGIVETPNACGGSCSGARSCAAYADAGTSCGEVFCNTRKDVAALECNGKGGCGVSLAACSMYACEDTTATCRTSCNANADCQTGFYCNGTNNQCASQKVDGISCLTDAECNSGHCSLIGTTGAGICCNTVCDSPNTCNGSGAGAQAGKCACPNVTNCATGVACQTFYRDADNDGYGDMATTTVGCADTVPAGYVADNTDCDDNNVNAHPGQTAYFGTPRSNGTFDYNCDGTNEKEFKEYPGASCTFCPTTTAGCTTASSTSCSVAGTQATFACTSELNLGGLLERSGGDLTPSGSSAGPALTVMPPIGTLLTCCGCHDASGFLATIACGASAAYYTCGTCSGTKATASTSKTQQQLCQ